jgi:hypothetical protein
MSLNRTLDRLFAEIRREARRNPDFADRMDAILRAHVSRRDVSEALVEEAAAEPKRSRGRARVRALDFNPVGLLQREGEGALSAALAGQDRDALLALIAEHNLDPTGAAADLDSEALAAHLLAQAKRRAERDKKLFDY